MRRDIEVDEQVIAGRKSTVNWVKVKLTVTDIICTFMLQFVILSAMADVPIKLRLTYVTARAFLDTVWIQRPTPAKVSFTWHRLNTSRIKIALEQR
jgi:hypothetical protein